MRDARITPIYEGTTGIQANDLVGRKIARDGGRAAQTLIEEMRKLGRALAEESSLGGARRVFAAAIDALESAVQYVVSELRQGLARRFGRAPCRCSSCSAWSPEAGSCCARPWWRATASPRRTRKRGRTPASIEAKIDTARFYADHVLSQAPGLAHAIIEGAAGGARRGRAVATP